MAEIYDRKCAGGEEIEISFRPMLPKIYEIMLPSLESRMNFINVGYKHAALYRYVHGSGINCSHAKVLTDKTKLLNSTLSKLLNVNGILEQHDYLNKE